MRRAGEGRGTDLARVGLACGGGVLSREDGVSCSGTQGRACRWESRSTRGPNRACAVHTLMADGSLWGPSTQPGGPQLGVPPGPGHTLESLWEFNITPSPGPLPQSLIWGFGKGSQHTWVFKSSPADSAAASMCSPGKAPPPRSPRRASQQCSWEGGCPWPGPAPAGVQRAFPLSGFPAVRRPHRESLGPG